MATLGNGDLDARILSAMAGGFPVSQSPYCDIADALSESELDVLNAIEGMRERGTISAIRARFVEAVATQDSASDADQALRDLISDDLPFSEHPYAEVAEQLQLRGIDSDEEWVLARIRALVDEGIIDRVSVEAS